MNTEYNLRYPDIFEIFEDNLGNLWACTRDAFIRIGLYDDSGYEIFNSGIFPWDNAFYNGSQHCALDRDTFAVSGMNGISTLTPGKVVSEMTSGKIVFSDISVGYNSIFDYGLPKNCVYKDNSLDLNKKNNGFSVKFASLEFSNSSLIRYSYRLKGYDKDWITCSLDTREANYTNLPKGRYTFEVRASNSSGKWRDTITTLSVRIRPGIFEAWYSYVLYVITFAGILYSVKRISSNRMRIKNQLQISEMEKEKNEELTRSKLRFFTNISHEFLTPLSIIGCSVENIHPMDQGSGNNIKIVQNNVQKLRNLIREILDFSKSESGKLELKVANGNIAELLRAICLNDFSVLSKEKNIVLEYDIPEVVQGWYDADKIDKIVSNLVSNALKYNFENSYVRVSLMEDFDEDKRYAVISVKDGGVGIPFDKIGKIFDHFYEGDFRETKKEGIGIGLALTKSLVELHKGSIDVHSILGVGTDFTVRIPINEKAYSDNERKTDTVWSVEDMECRFAETGKRILIVEDNKELRYLMSQYLAKYYVIEEASDGIEALKKLEDSYFDLIITDVMMPNMDGNELCRRIKGNAEYSEIPVLLLTAKSSEQDKIEGYDSGADAFMTKPFQMPLLVSRITNLLKSREQIKQNYIKEDNGIKITALSYTSLDEKFLQNAADLVLANISNEDFHMDDFISDMNVSKSTLYRKLKTLTGMSCSEFVKDMRLKEAARIIREKNVNVSEISYLVGFGQPKYFTYCFKKKFGVSPSEYMRQNQQQSL